MHREKDLIFDEFDALRNRFNILMKLMRRETDMIFDDIYAQRDSAHRLFVDAVVLDNIPSCFAKILVRVKRRQRKRNVVPYHLQIRVYHKERRGEQGDISLALPCQRHMCHANGTHEQVEQQTGTTEKICDAMPAAHTNQS